MINGWNLFNVASITKLFMFVWTDNIVKDNLPEMSFLLAANFPDVTET